MFVESWSENDTRIRTNLASTGLWYWAARRIFRRERAAESADLIRHQSFVGKSAEEVIQLLGPTSGYFWSDHFPTYFIEEGWTQKKDSWQLVFLLNEDDRVTEVRIHKNCCYNSLPWNL